MKKRCFFFHNYLIPTGYIKADIHGKITRLPKNGDILLILKCTDCESFKETFYKEVEFEKIETEIKSLNKTLNVEEKDLPYTNQVKGNISCGF